MLSIEAKLWHDHPNLIIAGVDEAGRGSLAGPVVAGAVSMTTAAATSLYDGSLSGLTDSKKMTAARREHCFELLRVHPEVITACGWSTPAEIDTLNILSATHLAMRRAVENLNLEVDYLLVDGLPVKGLPCDSDAIVKGDSKSFLIAAASVIAKVSRDRYMIELDTQFPNYGFAEHKGYGTNRHITALHRFGACSQHRRFFRPVQDVEESLPNFKWQS